PGAILVTAAVMASRTAGVTETAAAGVAPASAITAWWPDEQAFAASTITASAQRSFSMRFRNAPWRAGGVGMLARGAARNRASDTQNVSHQHPPNSVTPKSRVPPSAVEISKPVGGCSVALAAPVEASGGGSAPPKGGPAARAIAIPVSDCFSHSASERSVLRADAWSRSRHRISPASRFTSCVANALPMAWRSARGDAAQAPPNALLAASALLEDGAGLPHG